MADFAPVEVDDCECPSCQGADITVTSNRPPGMPRRWWLTCLGCGQFSHLAETEPQAKRLWRKSDE